MVAWFRHHNAQLDSHISAGEWTPDLVGLWTTETLAATAAMAVRTQSALMAGAGSHGVGAHHAASPAVHGGFTPVVQREGDSRSSTGWVPARRRSGRYQAV